jgi:AcrR family transcriptional regulator
MAMSDTRRRVLDAALACFLEDGYERTTIARIRDRSEVSNGALFHHFRSKEAIADALYVEAISSFQEGLWKLLRNRPRTLRAAVRGTIDHQLRWTELHPDHARFVYMRGQLDWDSPAGSVLAARNRDLAAAFRKWLSPLVQSGEVRPMSMLVITAIVSGPAHSIARRWLAGQLERRPTELIDELADAAAAGLRGRPVATRSGQGTPPFVGRMTIELVSEDGGVFAHGEATTPLLPAGT